MTDYRATLEDQLESCLDVWPGTMRLVGRGVLRSRKDWATFQRQASNSEIETAIHMLNSRRKVHAERYSDPDATIEICVKVGKASWARGLPLGADIAELVCNPYWSAEHYEQLTRLLTAAIVAWARGEIADAGANH